MAVGALDSFQFLLMLILYALEVLVAVCAVQITVYGLTIDLLVNEKRDLTASYVLGERVIRMAVKTVGGAHSQGRGCGSEENDGYKNSFGHRFLPFDDLR